VFEDLLPFLREFFEKTLVFHWRVIEESSKKAYRKQEDNRAKALRNQGRELVFSHRDAGETQKRRGKLAFTLGLSAPPVFSSAPLREPYSAH